MPTKLTLAFFALAFPLLARAQQAGLDAAAAERQALSQQMSALSQQVVDNMRAQGIDPAAFTQQMSERMQTSNLDPTQVMQEMLIEQGLITPGMFNNAMTTMRRIGLLAIRQELASPDEEWAIIEKKLQRVVAAMADADQETFRRFLGGTFGASLNNSPMQKARQDLREILATPNLSDERLRIVLDNYHREFAKAKAELNAARDDLTHILTIRQEAILLNLGVL